MRLHYSFEIASFFFFTVFFFFMLGFLVSVLPKNYTWMAVTSMHSTFLHMT